MAALLEIGQRQRLQVVVQPGAQVGQDVLGRAAQQPAVGKFQQGLHGKQHQQGHQQQATGLRQAREQVPGELARQPRHGQRHAGFRQHEQRAQRQRAAPGPCKTKNQPKVHRC